LQQFNINALTTTIMLYYENLKKKVIHAVELAEVGKLLFQKYTKVRFAHE